MFEVTKQRTFTDYLDLLCGIHDELLESVGDINESYEITVSGMETEAAEQEEKKRDEEVEEAVDLIRGKINSLRAEFEKAVFDFYLPKGEHIDEKTEKLINSGISLKDTEIDWYLEKYRSNPTMERLLCSTLGNREGLSQHIRNMIAYVYQRTMSEGKQELKIFDNLAELTQTVISQEEYSAVYESCKTALEEIYIQP